MNLRNQVRQNIITTLILSGTVLGGGNAATAEQPANVFAINVSQPKTELEIRFQSIAKSDNANTEKLPYGKLLGPLELRPGRWRVSITDQSPLPGASVEYGFAKSDRYLLILHGFNRHEPLASPKRNAQLWSTSIWQQARLVLGGIDETGDKRLLLQQTLLRIPSIEPDDPARVRVVACTPGEGPIVATIHDSNGNATSSRKLSYPEHSDWLKPSTGELNLQIRYADSPVLIVNGVFDAPRGTITTILVSKPSSCDSDQGNVIVHQQSAENGKTIRFKARK